MSAPREFAPAADATTQNRSNPSLKMFAPRAFAPLALRLCTLADPCAISQPRTARTETLHIGPRAASIEYLASRHPDDTNDDGSLDGEPSAPKATSPRFAHAQPPAPSPNYLTLTPSEIDRLLHDTRRSNIGLSIRPITFAGSPTHLPRALRILILLRSCLGAGGRVPNLPVSRLPVHFNRRI
ncbi:hypothetical protein PCANC_22709 [Puccinia coronata f. sp. avenae]|uniref:Uncharacterized protein n=1 Tax=Puccinia coronata f. sp. avenae TaxID=200324 RepID=A0A2N5TPB7_9BASI|nr:hypothetical protein PCANC_22709 [Puccinia coronata f. sp. avenae]